MRPVIAVPTIAVPITVPSISLIKLTSYVEVWYWLLTTVNLSCTYVANQIPPPSLNRMVCIYLLRI